MDHINHCFKWFTVFVLLICLDTPAFSFSDNSLDNTNSANNLNDIVNINDDIVNIKNEDDAIGVTVKLNDDVIIIRENMPEDASESPSGELVNAVNTTIENTGNIVRISASLLKAGELGLDQTVKTLQLLGDVIDLGASVSNDGGEVSIQKVADSIEFVEEIVNESVARNATAEQMETVSGHINSMLGNMPDIMNSALETEDVVTLLDPIQTLTGGGIRAALAGGADPGQTVSVLGSIVARGLQGASDSGIVLNTGKIIKSAGKIVNHAVNVLQTDTEDKTTIEATLNQLQIELSTMVEQTALNIRDKPVPSLPVASSGNSSARINNDYDDKSGGIASKAGGSFIKEDFAKLMDEVSGLTTPIIQMKSVLAPALYSAMQTLSLETMKNILPGFIPERRFQSLRDKSDVEKLLDSYPQFLDEVIKIASVNLTSGMSLSPDEIALVLENNPSFDSTERSLLLNGLPLLPAFDQKIIRLDTDSKAFLSLVDLLSDELQKLVQGISVEVNSLNGIYLGILVTIPPYSEFPLYIQDVRVISSLIPEGLYLLPEGSIVLVSNGIAGTISPAPFNPVATLLSADALLEIDSLFGSGTKEMDNVSISNSGNLTLTFNDGSRFSGAFGYGTTTEDDKSLDAPTSSFELHGTDPATEAYSVLVIYNDDDSAQQLVPSISALEQLVQVLDQLVARSYTLDRATGILTIFETMRFKPSYFLEAITSNDAEWFKNNKDSYGIAWEADDYNGDGAVDLKMWTYDGKQVLYTVIQ